MVPFIGNQVMMDIAHSISKQSKDLKEQVGASIRTGLNEVLCDFNRLPLGVIALNERLHAPLKFQFTEHAERAVIYKAAKSGISLEGATLFTTKSPCPDCARAIVMSGIIAVHTYPERPESSWAEDACVGHQILAEASVDVVFHTLEP